MVAQREFLENLRTKTFWIGILVAPIGIILFYAVMFLLAEKTDKRAYMVLDRSEGQWLSEAVVREAQKDRLSERIRELADDNPIKQGWKLAKQKLGKDPVQLTFVEALDILSRIEELKKEWAADPEVIALKERLDDPTVQALAMKTQEDLGKVAINEWLHKDFQQVPFDGDTAEAEDVEKVLAQKLQNEEIFAYFVIGPDPLDDSRGKYVSNNVTDFKLRKWYADKATDVVRRKNVERLEAEKGLLKDDVKAINRRYTFEEKQVSATGEETVVKKSDKTLQYAPILFVYILWLGVFIAAQMLLTNTVEEKSNRIIEVLLSSVSATQLMHGKIYGIALTGLTVLGSWAVFAVLGIKLAPHVIPASGGEIAELGLDQIVGNPVYVCSFLCYFLTGYLMYASLLVAIGSVCNSLKEAQNLMQPVIFILIVPLATMIPIAMDPNGTIARVMTYIPLYTPFTMMNRAGGPPDAWEYVASSAVILVTLWLFFRG
ncbi:MAG: ABC transporter permease, partial [Planctomycetota bacterium]